MTLGKLVLVTKGKGDALTEKASSDYDGFVLGRRSH
jgi:hypothetical protein